MRFTNPLKIFNFSSKNLTLSAWILAVFSLLSALLGVIRDRLLANAFGAGKDPLQKH